MQRKGAEAKQKKVKIIKDETVEENQLHQINS